MGAEQAYDSFMIKSQYWVSTLVPRISARCLDVSSYSSSSSSESEGACYTLELGLLDGISAESARRI